MVNAKLGCPIPVQPDKRMHDHVMDVAMGDVIDALVELITNADDSYGRLFRSGKRPREGGRILIERCEQRKGQASLLIVRDHAEGMTLQRMIEVLRSPGALTSTEGDRGYMGRGAKDCAKFGAMTFESIEGNVYCKCVLDKRATKIIPEDRRRVDEPTRQRLGIPHGNGTVVTLEVGPEFKIPQLKTLCSELSSHYALQKILGEQSQSEVLLRNGLKPDDKAERIVSRLPAAETILENVAFDVEGYPDAKARLTIYRAANLFDDKPPRVRLYGFLVQGRRAIHERSLLNADIERDPNSRRYFGTIQCDYIDTLLNEYEQRRQKSLPHPCENPRLLVDPGRRFGLEKEHPFTKALFKEPSRHLIGLLEEDRKKQQSHKREIANEETKQRLTRLSKAAARFLRKQIDDLPELAADEAVEENSFIKRGILIYPTFFNLKIGSCRELTVYVNRALLPSATDVVEVQADSEALEVLGTPFPLRPHKHNEDRLVGTFRVIGRSLAKDVWISAKCDGLPLAEAIGQVIDEKPVDRTFDSPVEFEHDEYRVKYNSRKTIRVFARVPDVVREETEVSVASIDGTTVAVRGKCILRPVGGTNYAIGECAVEGRRVDAKTKIRAKVRQFEAVADVKVVEESHESRGPNIEIELRDEDYGNFRARWADHEGRPNVLLVAGRHQSIARYLGEPGGDGKFPGQDSPIYRVLLAEIVAEAVCRKALQLEARERPWDFKWADLKDDDKISDDVLAHLQQRLREFLPVAHREMVREREPGN